MMMDNRRAMQTFTGLRFTPCAPDPSQVCLIDVAHHLSMLCRFTGASREFYSVAQHSVHVCDHLPREYALIGLLHDAAEAYVNDLSRPVKEDQGRTWAQYEARVHAAVCAHFGIPTELPELVRSVDDRLCATEARDLLGTPSPDWHDVSSLPPRAIAEPFPERIDPWSPSRAYNEFMARFDRLMGGQPHASPSDAPPAAEWLDHLKIPAAGLSPVA